MSFRLKCHHDDVQVLLCFYISQFVYDQSISWSHFHLFFIRLEINVCRTDQLFLWVNFDWWRPSLWRNVVASSLTLMQFLYPFILKHSIKRLLMILLIYIILIWKTISNLQVTKHIWFWHLIWWLQPKSK